MTEIPEHLLKRSRQRRGELTGEGAGPAADETPAASDPAPAVAAAASVPEPQEPPAPEPVAPYNAAAAARPKIPWWAAGTLLLLPIWAIAYVGTLERPPEHGPSGLLAVGESVYAARCASCHGASGQGGAGHAMADGEILATFPTPAEQVLWVAKGSAGYGLDSNYGDPAVGRVVVGGMPGFADALTVEELLGVVLYERAAFGHSEFDEELAEALDEEAHSGHLDLDVHLDQATVTIDEVLELLRAAGVGEDDQLAAG